MVTKGMRINDVTNLGDGRMKGGGMVLDGGRIGVSSEEGLEDVGG